MSSNIKCNFCKKEVKNSYLKKHQKTKTCMKFQDKKDASKGEYDFSELLENGVMVLPGPENISEVLKNFMDEQIEFTDRNPKHGFVMGGFGAFGNPTSFHHHEIRNIRKIVHRHLWDRFSKTFPDKKLEMLFDRFAIRRKGTSTTGESWHRDVGKKLEGDIIYGGWINLDKPGCDPQKFSCIPKTHIYEKDEKTGFVRFDKDDIDYAQKKIFEIPPGHIIIFNQDIMHEVLTRKSKFDSYRLFTGWRITDSEEPLFDHSEIIRSQGVPFIPSAQIPVLYGKMHLMNWRIRLNEFSSCVKPEFINPKNNLVQREMISLRKAGLQLWSEYTEEDKIILSPMSLIN